MTEKLTDEERALLAANWAGGKALRIIDAQAAVIERLRAVMLVDARHIDQLTLRHFEEALAAAPEQTAPFKADTRSWHEMAVDAARSKSPDFALAVAPKHTAPAISFGGGGSGVGPSEQLAAANARVAELERALTAARAYAVSCSTQAQEMSGERDAANARADAAEAKLSELQTIANDQYEMLRGHYDPQFIARELERRHGDE